MEDIEQLKTIYRSHYPGILASFEKQSVEEFRKLAKGIVLYLKILRYPPCIIYSLGKAGYHRE
jgi:hypothetical protein